MTPSEISALMREATDKINKQNAWIEKAIVVIRERKNQVYQAILKEILRDPNGNPEYIRELRDTLDSLYALLKEVAK